MWWGVVAALFANVLYSGGFVLQKRALGDLPGLDVHRPLRAVRLLLGSLPWLGGSLALAGGFAAQLIVYRTLPMTVAQALFISGLVLLLLLSSRTLGERISVRERYAMGAVVLALLMVVLSLDSGGEDVGAYSPPALILLLSGLSIGAGIWVYVAADRRDTARRDAGRSNNAHRDAGPQASVRTTPTSGVPYGVAVGFVYGVSSLAIKGVSALFDAGDLPGTVTAVLTSPYPYLLLVTGGTGLVRRWPPGSTRTATPTSPTPRSGISTWCRARSAAVSSSRTWSSSASPSRRSGSSSAGKWCGRRTRCWCWARR
ncbi:hypothetical protein SSPIM334S_07499 [Streptomyces spiroverticillatus]